MRPAPDVCGDGYATGQKLHSAIAARSAANNSLLREKAAVQAAQPRRELLVAQVSVERVGSEGDTKGRGQMVIDATKGQMVMDFDFVLWILTV